jgi:hypothetical protein
MAGRRRGRSRSPEGRRASERRASEGWAGSVWPTQTRAGWLSQAGWAEWANRPVGSTGQLGQAGLCQLNLIQISNLNSNANSFVNSNQIQKFKYL